MPYNLLTGNGLEKSPWYDPAYEMTEHEIARELYDPPYNPPSKTRPNLERIMKKKPVFNVMQMELPDRDRSNVKVNTSIDNSALGQRRRQMQNERQAQRE